MVIMESMQRTKQFLFTCHWHLSFPLVAIAEQNRRSHESQMIERSYYTEYS